jgi:antitoxin component YwqK of YwqJK toxin-antitoxin module
LKGRYYSPFTSNSLIYEGGFENGLFDGQGKYYLEPNGLIYEGSFARGKRNGNGILHLEEFSVHGTFRNNEYNGHMKVFRNGILQNESTYRDGVLHGWSIFYNNGVPAMTFRYENDEMVSSRPFSPSDRGLLNP